MGNYQTGSKSCFRFLVDKFFKSDFNKLVYAIKSGNINVVKNLHQQKVNFLRYLQNGDTPFHIAVRHNNFEIVKFIADNVPNLNFNDKNFAGDTPLLISIMNGNKNIFEYLLTKKTIDINAAENKGFTPFIAACANGNLSFVVQLVNKNCDIKLKCKDGQTGMHRAAFYGNIEVLKYLIRDLKMNVMLPDRKGNLPIHYACMKLNISCIRMLIKASHHSANELLYWPNKFGTKPIEILQKVLNRVREYDDPQSSYDAEQIEDYIVNKNLPPYKRSTSPNSVKSMSRANTILRRSSIFARRDSVKSVAPLIRLKSVAENGEKVAESQEFVSPTIIEEKPTENEEEQLIRIKKNPNGSSSDFSGMLPPIMFKKVSVPQNDSPSPSPTYSMSLKTATKFGSAISLQKARRSSGLKIGIKLEERDHSVKSSALAKTITPAEFLNSPDDDVRTILHHFTPSNKSKFGQ